jgi:hypothetical protein
MLNAVLLYVNLYQTIVFNGFNSNLYKNRRTCRIENFYVFLLPFMLKRTYSR